MRASAQVDAARRVAVAIGQGNSVLGPIRPAQLGVTSFHRHAVWSPSTGTDVLLAWPDHRQNQPVEYQLPRDGSITDLASQPDLPVLLARGSRTQVLASGRIDVRAAEDTRKITARVISDVVEGGAEPVRQTLHDPSAVAGLLSLRETSLR